MRGRRTLGLADVLLDLARRLLPAERRDWASAMRAEVDQVPQQERLRWATGCVWTAVKMRAYSMNTGSYRVSRGVMLVEAIGAFGPLTFAWYEVVSGLPGVARNSGHIQAMWMLSAVVDLLGPIGLFLGLRYVLTGKGIQQRTFGWTLAAVPVAANLVGAASGQYWGPTGMPVPASLTLLFVLLPASVIVHLIWLARPEHPAAAFGAVV